MSALFNAEKDKYMEYFGFAKETYEKIMPLLNQVTVTGIAQTDAFHEATKILRSPIIINVKEEAKEDGSKHSTGNN